jgi:hypothetical protein
MVTVICGAVFPPIPPLITIIRCQDPYYTVARLILPPEYFSTLGPRLFIALIRFLILTLTAIEISRILVMLVNIMCTLAIVMTNCIHLISEFHDSLSNVGKLRGNVHISLYKQFRLLIFIGNLSVAFPLLLAFFIVELLFISFSIILIKLHASQPLLIIVISLLFVMGIVILLGFLMPIVTNIYEQSRDIKSKWNCELGRISGDKRCVRKKLRSLREFYLYVGYGENQLHGIQREWTTDYLSGLVGHTVDVLLAIR